MVLAVFIIQIRLSLIIVRIGNNTRINDVNFMTLNIDIILAVVIMTASGLKITGRSGHSGRGAYGASEGGYGLP